MSAARTTTPGQQVGDPAATPDRASDLGSAAAIVDRDHELARLTELGELAFSGQAGTVLIAGEAGVGKTTVINGFIAEAKRRDPRIQVLRGECVPLGGEGLPYAPVVGLLHELAGLLGEALLLELAGAGSAELRWLIPEFGDPDRPVDGTRPQSRLRLFETISRLIEAAARQAPLIMIIEDLHWADESSRHLIEFLIRGITGVPVLIMISFRTDELTRRHPLRPFLAEIGRVRCVQRLEIDRLSDRGVEELINNSPVDPPLDREQLIKRVISASGGIPYFAVELVRASRTGGELPDTLRDTLLLRISRVGEDCQRLLRLMAIGGNRVEHDLLAAVAELAIDELEQILREATDANLLLPDRSGYAFRHALMREVLHDDLLPGELTRLHRAYALALEHHPELMGDSVRAVELAHHWYAARNNPEAFRWSVAAARLQRYGYAEALRNYERALELWEVVDDPQRVAGSLPEFLDEASVVAIEAGDADRSLALINEALRVAGPGAPAELTAVRLARKARRLLTLVQPGVLELIGEAVALVPSDRPTLLRARLLDDQATTELLLDKPASVETARLAIEAAAAVGDADTESSARNTLGCALATLGTDADEGLDQLRRAGELAVNDLTKIRFYINFADTLTLLGRPEDGARVAAEGRELAGQVGLIRHSGVMLAGNLAEAAIARGDWRRARELVDQALETGPTGNHLIHQRRLLAWIRLWMDDVPDEAAEILTDLERFGRIAVDGPQYHAGISSVRVDLALARNDPVTAWQIAREVTESLPWSEPVYDLRIVAAAAMAYGRNPERPADWAHWIADRIAALRSAPGADQWMPFITAELDGTVDGWRRAVERLTAARTPPHLIGYGYLRLAEHQAADGLTEQSRTSARASRELGRRHGLGLLLRWITEFLPGDGERPATDNSPLAQLTPRERDVLALIADGLSNRQIGERLVISTKTASVHVSHILAKLEVRSRLEAAAWFRSAADDQIVNVHDPARLGRARGR